MPPDALVFNYADPDAGEFSERYLPGHAFVVLNKRIGEFQKGQLVKTLYYSDRFIYALAGQREISFAYSSADLPPYLLENPDPYSVTRCGYMRKEVRSGLRWHERYFVLKNSKLSWFESEKEQGEPSNTIKLLDVMISRRSDLCFELEAPGSERKWRFETKTRDECSAWMHALFLAAIHSP